MTKDLNTSLRFGFLIHDVSRLRRVVVDRSLKPLGITRSQWWVLAFLSRRDGMKQTALADDLDLTRVAIGGLLDRMESGGLVERRADASDGRARRVFLTKAGAKLVTTIRKSVERVELEILARISEEDLNQAAATLLALKESLLEKIGADANGGADSDMSDADNAVNE
jgi:DNA-binding MarR family transcriptional regulator